MSEVLDEISKVPEKEQVRLALIYIGKYLEKIAKESFQEHVLEIAEAGFRGLEGSS